MTIIFGNLFIYVKNHTSKDLENATIKHTGNGGHPIKLGTIKAMSNDTSEEMYVLTLREKANLVFSYVLNGKTYSSVVYNNIMFPNIRPITITITEENGQLVFTATRISINDPINYR